MKESGVKGSEGGAQAGDSRAHMISVLGVRTTAPVIYTLAQSCSVSCPNVIDRDRAGFSVNSRSADGERVGFLLSMGWVEGNFQQGMFWAPGASVSRASIPTHEKHFKGAMTSCAQSHRSQDSIASAPPAALAHSLPGHPDLLPSAQQSLVPKKGHV